MTPVFAAWLAVVAPTAFPLDHQLTAVEQRFVAAARARDFSTMRQLLLSPVTLVRRHEISADEFIRYISPCRAMNPGGGFMGWACPAGYDGRPTCWSFAGGMRAEGEKIRLSGFGEPGPVSCEPQTSNRRH